MKPQAPTHNATELPPCGKFVCSRVDNMWGDLGLAITLVGLNYLLLLCGVMGDLAELEALPMDGVLYEPAFSGLISFFAHPVVSCQLLIGLCWLLFHFFVPRRAGVILRKAAFAFCDKALRQPVHTAHGCRAPPSLAGCL